jgi:hypothetical protein
MQRRASSRCGATMACVGHTSMQALQLPQCAVTGSLSGQRHVDVDLAEKEHRARVTVEHQRVLAAPTLAAARGKFGFEHRSRIGEGAVAEGADLLGDALGQFREPVAQHLVIVAAPRIDRHDGLAGPREAVELDGLPVGGVSRGR